MIKNKKKPSCLRSGSFRFSRKRSDNISSNSGNNNVAKRSQSDGKITITSPSSSSARPLLPLTNPRSYSPSDYYFHTTAQGGVNAPLTPLSEHYATNETLLSLFSTLYEKDQFSVAYAAGVKFVEVALLQIPKNGYFKSKKYRKQRTKSAADALRVTKLLGGMVDEMEVDEETNNGNGGGIEKIDKLQKLATLAQRSFEEAIDDELNDDNDDDGGCNITSHWDVAQQVSKFWKEWGNGGSSIDNMLNMPDHCCSLFSGDMNSSVLHEEVQEEEAVLHEKNEVVQVSNTPKEPESFQQMQDVSARTMSRQLSLDSDFEREQSQHQDEAQMDDTSVQQSQGESSEGASVEEDVSIISVEKVSHTQHNNAQHVDGPTKAREEDKSEFREYDQVEQSRSDELDEEFRIALSMSVSDSMSSTISTSEMYGTKRDQQGIKLPVAMVAKQYREKYESLRDSGSIDVRFLDTYQGRISEGTNGCTVVAPLMLINYFASEMTDTTNGIVDEMINEVIDVHTVSILPEVRRKLGLDGNSFIVPSDVHDYLIDVGLLSTSQFVGVCGGSILEDSHIEQFKSTLLLLDNERERERLKGKRLGATFFFAGHVIAFHIINHEGCNHIELIDSLPNHKTWVCQSSNSSDSNVSCCEDNRDPSETSSRCSDNNFDEMWERSERFDYEQNRNAVRVRCLDVRYMDTLIRHYALAKLSDEEKRFCDEHVWQEANSSFDPRVFQAFIWAEA